MSNKLGDYIEFKNGLNYDKTHKGNGCKIVGVANFKNNLHINFENLDEVKSDIVSDDMLLKNDDLLFVRSNGNKSLVGRCLFVSDLQEKMSFSGFTIRARIKNKQKLLPKYFLYYATAPNFKNSLYKKIGGGTNIRNLTQAVLEDINIELPELDNQKKIANCLDQITQKIQLNNKINDELEKLAKTLYDYWFVQFDFPDENNRPYKSSGGKMIYNEKLKQFIPLNWDSCTLNELCDMYQPQTLSEDNLIDDGEFFVYGANGIIGKYNQYNHSESEIAVACRGNSCGTINRTLPKSWITGNAMVVKLKNIEIHNEYLYHALGFTNIKGIITGSGQPQITRANLLPVKILNPDKNIILKYCSIIEKNVNYRLKNIIENQQLSKLRDFLLPMLMNGQVTIPQ